MFNQPTVKLEGCDQACGVGIFLQFWMLSAVFLFHFLLLIKSGQNLETKIEPKP